MMLRVTFTFYGNLNDFLPARQRNALIPVQLAEHAAVKHPIEALGVPHPEVAAILVNRRPVEFRYRLQDQDRVEVYPQEVVHLLPQHLPLRPPTPTPIAFAADTHLGQLAAYLRLLGFDTLYRNDFEDAHLAELAATEARVLLTRDRGLLKRRVVVHGFCVREVDPRLQIISVLRRFQLKGCIRPWQRCTHCNGLLRAVDKAAVLDRLQPKTRRYYSDFQECATCGQVYWQGSHFTQMTAFISTVMAQL